MARIVRAIRVIRGQHPWAVLTPVLYLYHQEYHRETHMSILTMPVSDVRKTLNELLSTLDRPIFVTARGRVKAVLIDIDSYNALLDEMDDLRDERDPGLRQAMEQARGAYQRGETIALKDALKEDGL